jgi:hypothetical protein
LEGVPDHTIAGHLLRITDSRNADKPLSDADIGAELAIFFAAGVDTTGHTISWTLYVPIIHKEGGFLEFCVHGVLEIGALR